MIVLELCQHISRALGVPAAAVEWVAERLCAAGLVPRLGGPATVGSAALLILATADESLVHPATALVRYDSLRLVRVIRRDSVRSEELPPDDPFFVGALDTVPDLPSAVALLLEAAADRDADGVRPGELRIVSHCSSRTGVAELLTTPGESITFIYSMTGAAAGSGAGRSVTIAGSVFENLADALSQPDPPSGERAPLYAVAA